MKFHACINIYLIKETINTNKELFGLAHVYNKAYTVCQIDSGNFNCNFKFFPSHHGNQSGALTKGHFVSVFYTCLMCTLLTLLNSQKNALVMSLPPY